MTTDWTAWNPEAGPEQRTVPFPLTPDGVRQNITDAAGLLGAIAVTAGALYVWLQQLEASRRAAVAQLREDEHDAAAVSRVGRQLAIDLQNVNIALDVLRAV